MIRFLQNNREASVAIIIVMLLAILAISDPSYLKVETLLSIYSNSLTLFVLAIGATMVMATRGLDVSVGSIMGLAAAIAGVCMNDGLGIVPAIGIALFVGLLCGLFNGFNGGHSSGACHCGNAGYAGFLPWLRTFDHGRQLDRRSA